MTRAAAVAFARLDHDEDGPITLLHHLHAIFAASKSGWLASKVLVAALLEHDEMWMEWRGVRGDERPRKLNLAALAELLRPFGIKPRKFWITRDPPLMARGYLRADLEAAWCADRAEPGTSGHNLRLDPSWSEPCPSPPRSSMQSSPSRRPLPQRVLLDTKRGASR